MLVTAEDAARIRKQTISTKRRVLFSLLILLCIIILYPFYVIKNEAFYLLIAISIFALFGYIGLSISTTIWYRVNRHDPVASKLYVESRFYDAFLVTLSKRFIIREWV